MKVYVLSKEGKPIMPTSRGGRVRWLLKTGKAKVVRTIPFTIQLLEEDRKYYTQEINLGIKPGSKELGISATSEKEELFCASVKLRTDIVNLLSTRKEQRRTRRSRLRYRKARFLNRVKTKKPGWIAPSIQNKIQYHIKIVEFVNKILPISNIIFEIAIFDIQKIKNPSISGVQYQEGPQKDFWNVREYVLYRDNYVCQHCKGKSGDKILNVHHIVSRKTGGDSPGNLITLCKTCHKDYHEGKIKLSIKKSKSYKDLTYLNIMRDRLYKELFKRYGFIYITYSYQTKCDRISKGLLKSIDIDAYVISSGDTNPLLSDTKYCISQIRRHNRQIHKFNILKGGKLKKNQADYKVFGYRLNDVVKYQGNRYYIGGRRSSGYFNIRSLEGDEKLNISYMKLEFLYEPRRIFMYTERRNITPIPPTALSVSIHGV
jgi:hypothetical protein